MTPVRARSRAGQVIIEVQVARGREMAAEIRRTSRARVRQVEAAVEDGRRIRVKGRG